MTEERQLAEFAARLAGEISDRVAGDAEGRELRADAFVDFVTEYFSEVGMVENPSVCYHQAHWGNGIMRLNGYAVTDDEDRLDIFTAIYGGVEEISSISGPEVTRLAQQASRVVSAAIGNIHKKMETASDQYSMMQRISEVLSSGTREVRVFVLTDGLSPIKRIKEVLLDDVQVKFEVYDLRRLMRTMASSQGREVIDVSLASLGLMPIPCIATPSGGEEYEVYLAIFPGEVLYQVYEKFGPILLEYNVRSFLQATGRVNRGIRETLQSEPQHFMAYNNGISVTVDELETEERAGVGMVITRLKGLQIVNGGQTTASIHRARKREGVDLSRVHIAVKITRLPPTRVEEMVPKISRYANTQNVIQEADFSSNEPFHIALERLSRAVWSPGGNNRWFYERARGQYRTAMNMEGNTPARLRSFRNRTPPQQRFSKTDVAKIFNSWNRLPHVVSGGAQKNFVAFMRSLRVNRGSSWEPDEVFYKDLIAKTILFKEVLAVVRRERFPAYRANIVCYLVAYLSHRAAGQLDFESIWHGQSISSALVGLLREWSHSVARAIQESAGGRNVTEWCKKEGCWDVVKVLDLPLPNEAAPEFEQLRGRDGEATAGALLSDDEKAAAAECMKLSAEQWFNIHLWGLQTGNLKKWQASIAHTLSGYAADGWQRIPSPKQARQGTIILETARLRGFWASSSVVEQH